MSNPFLYEAMGIPKQRTLYLDHICQKIASLCKREKLNLSDTVHLLEQEIDINRTETIIIALVLGIDYEKSKNI